ncbi:Transposase InsO and inactivated derivatives [Carnobacterium alterfunditum]|uniref:Transposase InsO and inactivated derivatives n=1 Tax=Carnobacterium alterfunditum TaxID=28230 RepID=A0A1N6ENH7_9LACT|nr:IS3 family transposase [Carnobacterium alterfunditum]SIN84503.1 Transposase InsO and inactivated derivatives [Carnobacterium alterfunditum]SIN91370.1 Transposase InsO and inactivated derivatives [Carnobacterium alterfunditum]
MSKLTFTPKQIQFLKTNPYVKNVSEKSITYSDEFKRHFVSESLDSKTAKQLFFEAGFDLEMLGESRIKAFSKKWRKRYRDNGVLALKDTRQGHSGGVRKTELTPEQQIEKLQAKISLLEQENELLKKSEWSERRLEKNEKTSEIFAKIHKMKKDGSYTGTIVDACDVLEVSRSGYYNYLKSSDTRNARDEEDQAWRTKIEKAYSYRGYEKGSRSIVMYFKNILGITVNRKKVQRLMRKFNIFCPIRKANPYKRMAKATKEHRTVENQLERQFDQGIAHKVLLTDITYLPGADGFLGYLSTIKDGTTKEILAHYVSDNLKLDISLNTVDSLMSAHGATLHKDAFIHSDQGVHYTSPKFHKKLIENHLGQSMSRRGNCWDNAPQESFFGHLKDEMNYENCTNLEELRATVSDYIDYYNNERGQWNLKKLPPVHYREQFLSGIA